MWRPLGFEDGDEEGDAYIDPGPEAQIGTQLEEALPREARPEQAGGEAGVVQCQKPRERHEVADVHAHGLAC